MSRLPSPSTFVPDTDTKAFRTALGRFTTGVTIVTARTADGPIGITANSFTSLSLDPALIMWSLCKHSQRHGPFVSASAFAVHVLSSDQREICEAFARSGSAFSNIATTANNEGVPIIPDCLAVFECTRSATHDAGDHTIIIGEVYKAHERPGSGLVFANGAFAELDAQMGRPS